MLVKLFYVGRFHLAKLDIEDIIIRVPGERDEIIEIVAINAENGMPVGVSPSWPNRGSHRSTCGGRRWDHA